MDKLIEIVNRAIADYGFRQIAQWSPDDVAAAWQLSPREAAVLQGAIKDELDVMPVPVEPGDRPGEEKRLAQVIKKAMASR